MESLKKYKAKGFVHGRYWGGGKGSYKANNVYAETKDALIKKINDGIANGTLDGGMGYETVLGAIMVITTITTITYEGKPYTNEETEVEFFGNLSDDDKNFLDNVLMNVE